MKRWPKVLGVLAVLYLLVVSCLFFALSQRQSVFLQQGQTVQGKVVGFGHPSSSGAGPFHASIPTSANRVAVVAYTTDGGATRLITSNPYSRSKAYTLGQPVTLVIHHAADPSEEVAVIKDHNETGLRVLPYVFLAAALLLAWYLGLHRYPGMLRRRHQLRAGRPTPAAELPA